MSFTSVLQVSGAMWDVLLISGALLMLRGAVGQVGAFCMTQLAQRLRLMVAGGEAEAAVDGAADGGGVAEAVAAGAAVDAAGGAVEAVEAASGGSGGG